MKSSEDIIAEHRGRGEYVKVEDLNIFYRRSGPEQGIPLVLTHGIPRSSFLYRKMIPILSENHPVRAWDLYGFGLSDKPQDNSRYFFPEFERMLGKFIDALDIERLHLVCHDVGGPFSIGYAMRNPEKIATLTILNTTVFLKGFQIPGPVLRTILIPLALQRLRGPYERQADDILAYIQKHALKNGQALSGAEGEAYKKLLIKDNGWITLARTLKAYRVVMPYLLDIQRLLPSFKRPTFVLWGKHDPFCKEPIAHNFVKQIPDAELKIIEGASHFLQEDAPEEAANAILDYIERRGGS